MKYFSPAVVAKKLGIEPQSITRLCREGKIDGAIPPSREWQIPETALLNLTPGKAGRPKKK